MTNALVTARNQIPGYSNYVQYKNNFPIAKIEEELLNIVSQKPTQRTEGSQNRSLTRERTQTDLPVMSDLGENLSYEHMRLIARPLAIALSAPLRA